MSTSLRVAHTSDVHLDSRNSSNPVNGYRNVAEMAFAYVVESVKRENCDLFLIVGDLFDHSRITEDDIDFVCNQLSRLDCPTALLPGNHDVHDDSSVWDRFNRSALNSNVHLFLAPSGSSVELDELDIRIWGKAMTEHSPENEPLSATPENGTHKWNIGLAHGQVAMSKTEYISSIITHDEIAHCGFDYLALGHVHVWEEFRLGDTIALYPGSPVKTLANSHGGFFAIVTLSDEHGVTVERREVPAPDNQSQQKHFHFAPGV